MSVSMPSPASSARPRKRTRLSADGDKLGEPAGLKKDPGLWFEDGNVVVVAQNTAFRVHRGVISRPSDVFSAMFAVPQPVAAGEAEEMDGCPVVRVQDSAHDFRHLLYAVYDGMESYLTQAGASPRIGPLAALARLSHKYQMGRVHQTALRELKTVFTDDLNKWKERELHNASDSLIVPEAIEIVNLFRPCGYDELLPVALLICTNLSLHDILHGVTRAGGTLESLDRDDLERCLAVREHLERRYGELAHEFLDTARQSWPMCATSAKCGSHIQRLWEKCRSVPPKVRLPGPHGSTSWIFAYSVEKHRRSAPDGRAGVICGVRAGHVLSIYSRCVEELWHDLPKLMDLKVPCGPPSSLDAA